MPQPIRHTSVSLFVLALGAATALAQTSSTRSSSTSGAQRTTTASRGGPVTKGPLPDPELLDGSKQAADKRSEYGMIGDFELPGDENARTGKVGGPQNPNQGQGGQQQQQGGGGTMAMPSGGSAGQQDGSQGAPPPGGQQQAQQGGSGQPVDSADPNAQAQGQQVGQLTGDAQGQMPAGGENKPKQVAIGDSAMRIETQNVAGVVGTQPAGQTQQHEKGTGTGGKQPTGNNSNKGAERGRTMPSGL